MIQSAPTSVGTGATCRCPLSPTAHVYSLACHERTLARTVPTVRELRRYLLHPDSMVRCYADWALEFTGYGWRSQIRPNAANAHHFTQALLARLDELS